MRILFVVPYVPNLVRVRPFNLIRALARRGHAISLATLWSKDEEKEDLQGIAPYCETIIGRRVPSWRSALNSLAAVPTGQPLQAWYAWSPALSKEIEALALAGNGFDVIHVEHLRGVKYAAALQSALAGQAKPTPVVWDSVDCISFLFRQSAAYSRSGFHRLVTKFELGRTEAYEARQLARFPRILVTSRQDQKALAALAIDQRPRDKLCVIPNGVDLDYFTPDPEVQRENNQIVVSGKMSYHANITMVMHLVDRIMPLVWERRPDVHLWVVGKDPTQELRALAERGRITVTGTVDDLRPYLRRAALAAAPLVYGAGIQNKVLESMACGTTVVAAPRAVSAIQAVPGRDLCVAQEPGEFAATIVELLDNPEKRSSIGEAGRDYVMANHHWERIAGQLEEVYHAVK